MKNLWSNPAAEARNEVRECDRRIKLLQQEVEALEHDLIGWKKRRSYYAISLACIITVWGGLLILDTQLGSGQVLGAKALALSFLVFFGFVSVVCGFLFESVLQLKSEIETDLRAARKNLLKETRLRTLLEIKAERK
jgi:hypothetical protein